MWMVGEVAYYKCARAKWRTWRHLDIFEICQNVGIFIHEFFQNFCTKTLKFTFSIFVFFSIKSFWETTIFIICSFHILAQFPVFFFLFLFSFFLLLYHIFPLSQPENPAQPFFSFLLITTFKPLGISLSL